MPPITPKKSRLKRGRSSPSGLTPNGKRQAAVQNVRWSAEEREYLASYVEEVGPDNVNFKDFAAKLNAKFSKGRTEKACWSTYKRQRALFENDNLTVQPISVVDVCDATVQTESQNCMVNIQESALVSRSKETCNACTQTDIAAGPRDTVVWGSVKYTPKESPSTEAEVGPRHQTLRELLSPTTEEKTVKWTFKSTSQTVHHKTTLSGKLLSQGSLLSGKSAPTKKKNKRSRKKKNKKAENQDSSQRVREQNDHTYARSTPKGKNRKKPVKRLFKAHGGVAAALTVNAGGKQRKVPLAKSVQLKALLHIGECGEVAGAILSSPTLKAEIMKQLCQVVGERPEHMRDDSASVLKKTDFDGLESLNFSEVVNEMRSSFPELVQILTYIMLPEEERSDPYATAEIIPKLALIYGIALQKRNHELSLMQRAVAACLAESTSDQKVYDRLNKVGVCASYGRAMVVVKQVGSRYMDLLVEAAKEGKSIRLIGDNLNFMVGVHNDKKESHKHMVHMFASAALISDHYFMTKPKTPEIPLHELKSEHMLLSPAEYELLRQDIIKMVADVAAAALPQLQFVAESVPKYVGSPDTENRKSMTEVIPLPVLPFNEQDYKQDVQILDFYEKVVMEINEKAGLDENTKYHLGGDQLTRERFSYAMFLRLGNYIPAERFAHLGPTTFEFFHLCMNYLEKMVFGELWNAVGPAEVGTMKGEKERIFKDSVDPKVAKAYEADKEFVHTFVDGYMVEALMEFFGIDNKNDPPTKNTPPPFTTKEEQKDWVYTVLGEFVDKYIFPAWSGQDREEHVLESVTTQEAYAVVYLANGTQKRYPVKKERIETLRKVKPDKVKDYGHCVLEVGVTFQYFLQLCKRPDRERMLALTKMMMLQLKTRNNQAKYPLELLRMLVQQYSLLPLHEACQVFQACFVNRKNQPDTHIPSDLQMEWLVKKEKGHIKHLVSNKQTEVIEKRSAALPGLQKIADNYDETAAVVERSQKHKKADVRKEVEQITSDLRAIRPFRHEEGRSFASFGNIETSQLKKFDGYHYRQWYEGHKNFFVA